MKNASSSGGVPPAGGGDAAVPPRAPPHPARRGLDPQPEPEPTCLSSAGCSQQWQCMATVEQARSGKAAGKWDAKTIGPFRAATAAEVIKQREKVLLEWLAPPRRAAPTANGQTRRTERSQPQ
eukprot:scaffold94807_cov23-Tisochrysis_lutea.AAC.2